MENTRQFNLNPAPITRSAFLIDKVHRCTDCPIRGLAKKHPQSVFARLHAWHRIWWPGWQAHRARECALVARRQLKLENS